MKNEWYKDWFASEDYLDVYHHRNSEDADKLFTLILGNTNLRKSAKVLDAACGAGRHSLKFAENGFEVDGFDLSDTLLKIAKKEANYRNLPISFYRADLRNFSSDKEFDLVVNLFTSFGYFDTDEENFEFPLNAFKMLKKNGYYVLDYLNKLYVEQNLVASSEKNVNGKEIFEKRRIEKGRVIKNICISKRNEKYEYLESVKLYSKDEIISEFDKIGFSVKEVFGNYLGKPYEKNTSERCIIIFQK